MKVIVLAEDTIIDDRLREAGEQVTVPDDFDESAARRVVKRGVEKEAETEVKRAKERVKKAKEGGGNGRDNPK